MSSIRFNQRNLGIKNLARAIILDAIKAYKKNLKDRRSTVKSEAEKFLFSDGIGGELKDIRVFWFRVAGETHLLSKLHTLKEDTMKDNGHTKEEYKEEEDEGIEEIDPQTGEAIEPSYLRVGRAKKKRKD